MWNVLHTANDNFEISYRIPIMRYNWPAKVPFSAIYVILHTATEPRQPQDLGYRCPLNCH
jgi:hypothetical protein